MYLNSRYSWLCEQSFINRQKDIKRENINNKLTLNNEARLSSVTQRKQKLEKNQQWLVCLLFSTLFEYISNKNSFEKQ